MNSFFPPNFHPESRCESLLTIDAKNETLIYDLTSNRALCLNETASAIWSQCDGKKDINGIIKAIKKKHNIDSNEELIALTLHELNQNNLLIKTDHFQKISQTFNRREMIKRIGYTTAFALPVITSLVAPMAINAQSGIADGICDDNCIVGGTPCSCSPGLFTCPNGTIVNIGVLAGVCVGVGISIPGIPLPPIVAGAGICLYANLCV